jgi:hypothetical protein
MDRTTDKLARGDLEALVEYPAGKMRGVEFAGFLVREEDDALYVADPQGTWMIPRDSILSRGAWEAGHCIPEDMRSVGDPVRVTLKENALFYEVRPWRVTPDPVSPEVPPPITGDGVRDVFSLASGQLPMTEGGFRGEMRLRSLERQLTRRLGFWPDICSDPHAYGSGGSVVACGSSATSDQNDAGAATRSDTDADF